MDPDIKRADCLIANFFFPCAAITGIPVVSILLDAADVMMVGIDNCRKRLQGPAIMWSVGLLQRFMPFEKLNRASSPACPGNPGCNLFASRSYAYPGLLVSLSVLGCKRPRLSELKAQDFFGYPIHTGVDDPSWHSPCYWFSISSVSRRSPLLAWFSFQSDDFCESAVASCALYAGLFGSGTGFPRLGKCNRYLLIQESAKLRPRKSRRAC